MICPVCEHSQELGVECEVCGKDLAGLGGLGSPPVRAERLEGLELTAPEPVGEISVEPIQGLDITPHAAVDVEAVKVEVRLDELESTLRAPVGEVPVEALADLSVDRVPDDGQRTPPPGGPITCRYCRNVQAVGSFCERCGMKLSVALTAAPTAEKVGMDSEAKVRCRSCGALSKVGQRCGDCGNEVPYPEA